MNWVVMAVDLKALGVIAGVIVSLLVIIGIVLGVVVFVRGAYGAARLAAVREDNTDLRAAREDDKRQHDIDMTRIEALTLRVSQLEAEGTTLREMALQHANVDKAIDAIKEHDKRSEETWNKVIKLIEGLNGKEKS